MSEWLTEDGVTKETPEVKANKIAPINPKDTTPELRALFNLPKEQIDQIITLFDSIHRYDIYSTNDDDNNTERYPKYKQDEHKDIYINVKWTKFREFHKNADFEWYWFFETNWTILLARIKEWEILFPCICFQNVKKEQEEREKKRILPGDKIESEKNE